MEIMGEDSSIRIWLIMSQGTIQTAWVEEEVVVMVDLSCVFSIKGQR